MSAVDKKDITEKETQVLAMAWKCFKAPPEVDYDKLAKLTGYANPKSVQNVIYAVKKKIEGGNEGPATPTKPAPKAKATPASRKRKVARNDEEDGDDPITSTPRKRARGKKLALSKETVNDDDDDDSESGKKGITQEDDIDTKDDIGEGIVD
ncbi:hypothetical protein F5Y00DRAFT_274146 [Daldinia vernicosa]|uniref:uncharacterized protein n=1 Tax=Daldinia vernicosa TaxID=114800 RepID=UPI002008C688|nr:uncharacterized protein F5Y00DRAFT_274146 [Daldinia vernicosa]KAI0844275.1 hypothetical protein F5Y00DRAFT_274146 [Daldinia vernicosa]